MHKNMPEFQVNFFNFLGLSFCSGDITQNCNFKITIFSFSKYLSQLFYSYLCLKWFLDTLVWSEVKLK